MEELQRQHIQNNLTELAEETTCSAQFMEMLTSRKILDANHITNLNLQDLTPTEKSKIIYELITKEADSFDVLLQALERTKQTEALKILLDSSGIFPNYGIISYCNTKVLRAGSYGGERIYKGRFGGRDAAVKVLNADIVSETRFALREVQILNKLDSHENIVRYFTVEAREGSIYIALELFETCLQDEIKLSIMKINPVTILKAVSKGVAYLHSSHVIHTDLNPSNVLLKDNGQIKICNFGLATQKTSGMESVSVNLESDRNKDWMAPELLRHFVEDDKDNHISEMSSACDVFSLGCIFFFVLMKGVHPFGNPVLRQSNIYYGKPQLQNSSLDPNWLKLVKRMISHASSDRPSAKEVLLDSCFTTKNHREMSTMTIELPGSSSNNLPNSTQPTQLAPELEIEETTSNSHALENFAGTSTGTKRSFSSEPNLHSQDPCSSSQAKKQKISLQAQTKKKQSSSTTIELQDHVDESGNNAIFRAVLKGTELTELKRIVENGSDVKVINNAGESVLHLAIHHKDFNVLKFLISAGANVNLQDSAGALPIHKLGETKDSFKEKLMLLCENGADINAENAEGYTILDLAALNGRGKDDVQFIISKSGDWKRKHKNGQTVLHLAVEGGNPDVIKLFLKTGIKIHVKANNGEMPVHRIAFTKQNFKETLDTLLVNGANISAPDKDGDTVLGFVAWAGRSRADLEYIISKGADWKAKNCNGQSILHLAAQGGNPEAIKLLIELGADVNFKDRFEEVPLHQVAVTPNDFKGSLDVLLESGADINEQDQFGDALLNMSIRHGRPKVDLEYIVGKGGNWKMRNMRWESVLHVAAQEGNIEAIKYFVALGVSINSEASLGTLPLHDSIHNTANFKEALNVLLEQGTSINATNEEGDDLLKLAAWQGRATENLDYIIQKGGNCKSKNKDRRTILHMSALGGNAEALRYFIPLVEGKVNVRDRHGDLPIHLVADAEENFKECVEALLENGAKINCKNKQQCTLLDLAVIKGREDEDLEFIVSKGGTGQMYDGKK